MLQAGTGFPVLLLPGFMDHIDNYINNIEAVASYGYKVYAFDFFEHPKSNQEILNEKGLEPSLLLDQVVSFISQYSLQKVNIVGLGIGAWIALKLAILHEDLVNKLVLSSVTGVKWNPELAVLDSSWSSGTLNWMLSNSPESHPFSKLINNNENLTFPPRSILTEEDLGFIKAKALVVGSNQNEVIPVELAEHMATLIPNTQYYCFTDSGFRASLDEQEKFNRIVGQFFMQ